MPAYYEIYHDQFYHSVIFSDFLEKILVMAAKALAEAEENKFDSLFLKDYEPLRILGSGRFVLVFEAKCKIDGRHYAVKRLHLSCNTLDKEKMMREVDLHAPLSHPNIVRISQHWVENPPCGWQAMADIKLAEKIKQRIENPCCTVLSSAPPKPLFDCDAIKALMVTASEKAVTMTAKLENPNIDEETKEFAAFSLSLFDVLSAVVEKAIMPLANAPPPSGSRSANNECDEFDEYLYIVMELCSGGTLQDWLENTPYRYPRPPFMAQIRLGIDYIHKQGLIHRDLKPSNVFLSKNEQGDLSIKIGGFGLATQKCRPDDAMQMDAMDVGTPTYWAPEILENKGNYDHTVDTYSMGLICLAILFKWNTHEELDKLYTNARIGIFPTELKTSDSGRLVAMMLCEDSEIRRQACLLNEHDPGAESNFNLSLDPDLESVKEPFYDTEQDLDCDGADIEDTGMIFHKGTTIMTFC